MEEEIKRLKHKVNSQIDALKERDKKINQLKKQLDALSEENLKLIHERETANEKVNVSVDAAGEAAPNCEIAIFFAQFGEIVKKIHTNGQFIPYKNATKYSGSFCKVERNTFESYLNEIAPDAQEFLERCKGFLCVKSENGKCVFNNDKIRVYFLNRQIVNMILGCSSEEAPDAAKVV